MKISVVVPAFNEEKLLPATLLSIRRALQAFSPLGWESEVIVCDNNSTDRTAEIARENGAAVVFEPVNQIARARNTGARAASGDWLIFVDADSRPSPELFSEVAEKIQSGRYIGGGVIVRMDERHFFADFATGLWNFLSRCRLCVWFAGSFSFIEMRAFRQVGGFNEELYASEEVDLSIRLNRLARSERKRMIILHRHPLETSARKLRLYSTRELLSLIGRSIFRYRSTVTNRDACSPWYDGRR